MTDPVTLLDADPRFAGRPRLLLGEGAQAVAYRVDDVVVRITKDPTQRETDVGATVRSLELGARYARLPVPTVREADPATGVVVVDVLPGRPLIEIASGRREVSAHALGAVLGDFLAGLHAVPVVGLGVPTDVQPLPGWLNDARHSVEEIGEHLPHGHRAAVAAFLDTLPSPPEPLAPVLSHNDLGMEHVLVDEAPDGAGLVVTGVIDWGDTALCDPAHDLSLVLRDLGPTAFDAAVAAYGPGGRAPGFVERARFLARCGLLEDFAHGVEQGRPLFVDKSLLALDWLFGTSDAR